MAKKSWQGKDGLLWDGNVRQLVLIYLENDHGASANTAIQAWELMMEWPQATTMFDLLDAADRALRVVCSPEWL
jgi:hypothetical protein